MHRYTAATVEQVIYVAAIYFNTILDNLQYSIAIVYLLA